MLRILSEFAQGDRYSNIDLLVGGKHQGDPIASWFIEVDIPLYETRISKKKIGDKYFARVFECTQQSSFLTSKLMVVVITTEKDIISHEHCNKENADEIANKIVEAYEKEVSKHQAANKAVGLAMKDLPANLACPTCGAVASLPGGLDEEQLGVI